MLNPPFVSARPIVLGVERQTNWIIAVSGGAVPSSIKTLPDRYNGCCEKSGWVVALGLMFGCVGLVGRPGFGAPPPAGGLTPCASNVPHNASPSEQRRTELNDIGSPPRLRPL